MCVCVTGRHGSDDSRCNAQPGGAGAKRKPRKARHGQAFDPALPVGSERRKHGVRLCARAPSQQIIRSRIGVLRPPAQPPVPNAATPRRAICPCLRLSASGRAHHWCLGRRWWSASANRHSRPFLAQSPHVSALLGAGAVSWLHLIRRCCGWPALPRRASPIILAPVL